MSTRTPVEITQFLCDKCLIEFEKRNGRPGKHYVAIVAGGYLRLDDLCDVCRAKIERITKEAAEEK